MKFGAVIVLFNPSCSIMEKVEQIVSDESEFVFVDNSLTPNEIRNEKVKYIHNKNNGGIAGAFNMGISYLYSKGCDFVFTFDQDSIIPANFFSAMKLFIAEKKAEIVCPNFFDVNSKTYATFVKLKKFSYHVVDRPETTAFAISSGMGISKEVWNKLGKFKEEYIIDHVDTDYCLRAMGKNINIYVNYDVCLEHSIGNRTVHKLLGITIKPNHHSAVRKYYIVRNGTHLSFHYFFRYPSYFYLNFLRVIHESVCVLFYEKCKIVKVKAVIKGLVHSVIGRLDVYE